MRDLRSQLDDVPGIGPRRRRALLTKFGSVAGVRRATREELDAVVGPQSGRGGDRLLRTVRVNFHVSQPEPTPTPRK
jgi:excinuclease ABC subunit C